MRSSWLSVLLLPSPTRYTKRTVHIRTVRFSLQAGCKKPSFLQKKISPAVVFCFFSSRKEIVPLLFFLEEKKQRKIKCGAVVSLFSCCLRQRVTQNGRFTYEPSVFSLQAGCKKTVFPAKENLPRNVFCFFSSRKEIVPPMTCLSFALVHASRVLRRSSSAETADSPPL